MAMAMEIASSSSVGGGAAAGARAFASTHLTELLLSREAHLFLRARNNILEILETRGFDVSPLTAESPEEISVLMENPVTFTYFVKEHGRSDDRPGEEESKDDGGKEGVMGDGGEEKRGRRCKVFFSKKSKGIPQIMDEIAKIHMDPKHPERLRPGIDEALIIAFDEISEKGIRTVISRSTEIGLHMDAVSILNLQFNPLKHELVPDYEIVPLYGELDKEIIASSSIKKRRQLPLIHRYDIISRLLGLRTDQLVIVRNRGPTGRHTFVRVCVD